MFLKLLLMLSLSANATEPAKFSILEYKQPAPFAGVIFDEKAMAKVLADFDIYKYSCDIKMDYELKIQKEEYEFKLADLKIEHKALTDDFCTNFEACLSSFWEPFGLQNRTRSVFFGDHFCKHFLKASRTRC